MTRNTAKQFWKEYIKLACSKGTNTTVLNPIHTFIQQSHMGIFDKISDKDFAKRRDDIKELALFWDDSNTETAGNILFNALTKTDISDMDISNIAGILASASVRSHYSTEDPAQNKCDKGIPDPTSDPDSRYAGWTPRNIYDYLSQHIYGQEEAKRAVSMLVYHHLRGNSRNIVMAGPTGCGKTEIWRALSKQLDCIRIINGPQLSGDGWKGSLKISDIFTGEPEQTAGHLIIVIDEADKMCEPAFASGGNDTSMIIQNELLKLMDGDILTFADDKNRNEKIVVNCSGISVVLCGSFERMLRAKSESSGSIGFGQSTQKDIQAAECTEEDLVKYANIRREIAGRISRIVTLNPLDKHDFEAILQSPASPIQKIERSHHISLFINAKTRKRLACDAEKSKMGCRYIRSKLENMLDEQMFDSPDTGRYELDCI